MATKTITVSDADVEVWDAAARQRGGGSADGQRSAVARDLLALLGEEDAAAKLCGLHALLLRAMPRSHRAEAMSACADLEGIVRRLDPAAVQELQAARQAAAQAGGAA